MKFNILDLVACDDLNQEQRELIQSALYKHSDEFNALAKKLESEGIIIKELNAILDINSGSNKVMCRIG